MRSAMRCDTTRIAGLAPVGTVSLRLFQVCLYVSFFLRSERPPKGCSAFQGVFFIKLWGIAHPASYVSARFQIVFVVEQRHSV